MGQKIKRNQVEQVAFRAFLNVAQNSSNGTFVALTLNTEQYDVGSCFDVATYTFTAPYAGIYHFSGAARSNTGASITAAIMQLNVNGSGVAQGDQKLGPTGGFDRAVIVTDYQLAAGDTVRLAFRTDGVSAAIANGPAETYFCGHLICRV
jgi:hypothetical protein